MRRPDDGVLEPGMEEVLRAIDATLAGEAVAPEHADIAELSLLLTAGRPQPDPAFAHALDEQVEMHFAGRAAAGSGSGSSGAAASAFAPRGRRSWLMTPAFGAVGAGLAAVVVAVVIVAGQNSPEKSPAPIAVHGGVAQPAIGSVTTDAIAPAAAKSAPAESVSGGSGSSSSGNLSALRAATVPVPATSGAAGAQTYSAPLQANSSASSAPSIAPVPPGGRKVIQSATLTLGAAPNRIEQVAQEAFNVIAGVGGIVDSSSVTQTGGPDGSAYISLRVPSGNLQRAMSQLSQLTSAHVQSRTDNLQDVNNQFVDANRHLADAQALRTKLLKQLQAATTQSQIDSLKAQIQSAESTISILEATLRGLQRQVSFSRIQLTIQASGAAVVAHGGGFNLHKAAHDAVRVLTVGAGVALISLAVLVPIGLVVALAWWIGGATRRRRREQALDLAI